MSEVKYYSTNLHVI